MKTIEQLEKLYEKEASLAEKHKNNAVTVKKEIESRKASMINSKAKELNLSGQEYDRLLKLLANKKNLMEAIDLVIGTEEKKDKKEEATGEETD